MNIPAHEAVVLAGGLGTRIRFVVPDRPKVMADVGGRPFLEILLDQLSRGGVRRAILATGYLHADIERHFGDRWDAMALSYSVEDHPLGTGGALRKALSMTSGGDIFVLNGDTYADVDLTDLLHHHRSARACITVTLKRMEDVDRYGTVTLKDGRITGFYEKREQAGGMISCGIYVMTPRIFDRFEMPEPFSLETDFLEDKAGEMAIAGFIHDGYFVDIGVPGDYARACRELPRLLRT